ncbi:hemicentin-1-like [Lineus longissimus]|uniref:hemicentin-1-like n=1 Tax=Lineus longissimus TaxID=88925 RepID=UPI00315D9E4E
MTNKREKVPYSHHVITTLLFISLILNCANAAPSYSVNVSPTTVGIGDSVTLSCRITDPSGFTVQWRKAINGEFKDVGTATKNGCKLNRQLDSTNYRWDICGAATNVSPRDFNLKIIKARPADAGTWDCIDIGKGTPSDRVEVKVQVPPHTPTVTGLDKPVGVGTTHTLTCDAHQPGISNSIAYTWYKDNIAKATLSDLSFNPVSKADAGSYRCEAKNAVATTTSKSLDFEVYYPPNTITLSSTKSVRPLNQRETFTCMTSGSNPPNPILTIYRDKGGKKELLTRPGPTILLNDRTMAKSDNQAKFYCESSVSGYPSMFKKSNEITYTVYYPHTVTLLTNSTRTVVAGTTFTSTCNATGGNPENVKQYRWTRNGKTLQSTSRVYYRYDVKYDDGGNYGCTATNDGGSTSDSMNITVNYPPIWNPALPEVLTTTATLNQPAKFTLHVIANPVATVATWFRYHSSTNFTALDSDFTPAKVNETTYTLEIKSVKQDYFGQYKVDVTSPTGPSAFIFKLTPPGPPSAPSILKVVNSSAVAVTLKWISEFNGDSEQRFYIQYKKSAENWDVATEVPKGGITDPGLKKAVYHKVMGLESNVWYMFRVRSNNSMPGTHASNFSNITSGKTPEKPELSLISVNRIRKKVTVEWERVTGKYTGLKIRYCLTGTDDCMTYAVPKPEETHATFFVDPDKTYYYYVLVEDGDDVVYRSRFFNDEVDDKINIGVAAVGGLVGAGIVAITGVILAVVLWKRGLVRWGKRHSHRPENDTVDYDDTRVEFTTPGNRPIHTSANIGTGYANVVFHPERSLEQPPQPMPMGHHLSVHGIRGNEPADSNDVVDGEVGAYDYATWQQGVPGQLRILEEGQPDQSTAESSSGKANRGHGRTPCRLNDNMANEQESLYAHIDPEGPVKHGEYLDFRQLSSE